ncbi:hypothetical protein T439DRAFT_320950 [Meredithblackwellia eburnea MCA 4105]
MSLSASKTVAAKVTATIVGNAGAILTTSLPPAPTATKAAAASILDPSHPDPTKFDSTNPLILFILQATLIVFFSRFLHFFLARLRQPRVISEVIAGILIGPSAFGRIPGFTSHMFPTASVPYINLVANIGLTLFLFLVGMEVDFSVFRRNYKASVLISSIGIVVPFALGAAVSIGVYHKFVDESKVKFGTFLLFIGTANGITAFPVLARILTELQLLGDHVGVTVLSAGVGNDVIGWILLALAIALTNASSGIIVLYIILCAIGWILLLWFIVRPLLVWGCRRTGAFGSHGPSQGVMCAVVFIVFISAWVTDRIGIHAIFGGFLAGLIIPTPIRAPITEKIEDLVAVLFLPLYFALSGLKTDLGLLRDGSIWGWTICVIIVAFASKFISCGGVAKLTGMNWRESGAVGSLMACKGLVELIVLNIGLSAGILNNQVFAMFVTMALVTTFVTTPLTIAFYPLQYRQSRALQAATKASSNNNGSDSDAPAPGSIRTISRYAFVLQQFEHLPALFAFCKLVKAPELVDTQSSENEKTSETPSATPVSIDALRLVELTDRTSAILKASDSQETLVAADSLSQVFKTYVQGAGIDSTTALEVVGQDQFSTAVATHASEHETDLVVVPWAVQNAKVDAGVIAQYIPNPLEGFFRRNTGAGEGTASYAAFVRRVFADASCDVGLFLDRGNTANTAVISGRAHIFFAFHGGTDDRACLNFIVQLARRNPGVSATIVRVTPAAEPTPQDTALATKQSTRFSDDESPMIFSQLTIHGGSGPSAGGAIDTVYPTEPGLASETADSVAIAGFFETASMTAHRPEVAAALSRIAFSEISSHQPLHMSIAQAEVASKASKAPLVLVAGRGRRDAKSHQRELGAFLRDNMEQVQASIANSSEVRKSLGDVAVAYLVSGLGSSLFVLAAAGPAGTKSKDA